MDRFKRAEELMRLCRNLPGAECLKTMNPVIAAELYNGAGPEWHSDEILKIYSALDGIFEPAEFLCDILYAVNKDRTREGYLAVNKMFYEGCKMLVKAKFGWYNPKRYWLMYKAGRLFASYLRSGHGSWMGWTIKNFLK